LSEQPGHDKYYHWNDIPMDNDHLILAETAFNAPNPAYASTRRPDDWALWSAGLAVRQTVQGRTLNYHDVPISAANHTLVANSHLLNTTEKMQWLENERLQSQFVAAGRTISYLDIDPDTMKTDVAQSYLNAANFALWQERAAVTADDFPLNATLFQTAGTKLLSNAEQAMVSARLAVPDHAEVPAPTVWPDVPPRDGKRLAAEILLSGAQYAKWQTALALDQSAFPQVWTNDGVRDLADRTLSPDEHLLWSQTIGAGSPIAITMTWLMIPHRASATVIAERLLAPDQFALWSDMAGRTLQLQHLGNSRGAANWAKSILSASDYATWLNQAAYTTATWQAFEYDSSLVQQRVVEAIFGVNSSDAVAWRAWAAPPPPPSPPDGGPIDVPPADPSGN
jgi:hypothetical protein